MTARPAMRRLVLIAAAIVGIWIVFAFFSSSEFYRRGRASGGIDFWSDVLRFQLASALLWAVFTPVVVFLAERLPLQKPDRLRNGALLLVLTLVLATGRAAFGGAVTEICDGVPPTLSFALHSIKVRFHRNVFLTFMIVGITNLLVAHRRAAARELSMLATKADRAGAALLQFRNSLQPRFVISTLDAIAARVGESPAAADRMLMDLGDLLRTTLEYQQRDAVTLTEELELVDRYLDIRKARSRGRFRSRIDVDDAALKAEVPPLILQSVLESVVAGDDGEDDWLDIEASAAGGVLRIRVASGASDNGPDEQSRAGTRTRPEQMVSGATSVTVRREKDRVVTTIEIPLRHAVMGASP